ncbi:MAG: glycoside hydrolase family 5 protein [Clostridiales bacterium]|jgi:aryl-phospho-beta-D-glucosidase BglC (GH1 family)|nr:glycoside hydrolase family 5 protein [Clostridiales bacterium]
MDFLSVKGRHIVRADEKPIILKGVNIGGWMNMEDFINQYCGCESSYRKVMAQTIEKDKSELFFNLMADYFFAEEDIIFLKETGFNIVRLPLNYRHFESDSKPFEYLETGFARLDGALSLLEKHGIYAILDMHSAQGWQNTDWHCDNAGRHSLFWSHVQYQERFRRLWREIAYRYKDRAVIAMYDLMNEPIANARYGRFSSIYKPDWANFNKIYRESVNAIRKVDPKHIILLEGDNFSVLFDGMEAPFAENLAYSSHNYIPSGLEGSYPGICCGEYWNLAKQHDVFYNSQGVQFALKYNVPLFVTEFGSAYNGDPDKTTDRLRSQDDQLAVFTEFGAHWTVWTYKDTGVMSLLTLAGDSEYIRLLKTAASKREELNTQFAITWRGVNESRQMSNDLADLIQNAIDMPHIGSDGNRKYLAQSIFGEFAAIQLQPMFAAPFLGMSEEKIDDVLSAFSFSKCTHNSEHIQILQKYARKEENS